jgi:putative restriction endonuclease
MISRKPWTREELILAINLYCKTPFGKIHYRNPEIIKLSEILGRSPGSVSYKLANFASLDSTIDRKGAPNVSKLDREVWQEFFSDCEEMAFQSETLYAQKTVSGIGEKKSIDDSFQIEEGKTKETVIKARVNQGFFRKMVLAAYDNTCCVTGLNIADLLIASHIMPWSVDVKNRLNPCNGLCLNALHDMAFDKGYISISDDFRVLVSPRIEKLKTANSRIELLLKFDRKKINLPSRFIPDQRLLERHRKEIFRT